MCEPSFFLVLCARRYFSILHVFFPLALWFQFCAEQNDINGMLLFFFALLALVPQAERMGYVTEQLCLHVGEVAAGLINVSMGNLPELIVVIFALAQDTPELAEESLVGGVMSNMLLVTGLALFAGCAYVGAALLAPQPSCVPRSSLARAQSDCTRARSD